MEEKSTQKSRTIAVLIIIITLTVVSLIIPSKWLGEKKPIVIKPKLDLSVISLPEEVATDTNSDGVISWAEVMSDTLKTTPATLESLKKIPIDPKSIEELNDPNNLTASFSKNLFLTAAYIQKNEITSEEEKQEAINALGFEEKSKITKKVYIYKDIHVASTESKDSIRVYGNNIATLLTGIISEKLIVSDLTSISNFSQTKKVSDLAPIIENKKRLDSIIKKLTEMPVPPSASLFHLSILNNVNGYRELLTNLTSADKDPLRATLVLDSYTTTVVVAGRAYLVLNNYFTLKNIVFTSKESGYMFTAGYTTK